MERIGGYLNVGGPLYSNAIDALGGNKSVRFANAKLLIGLSWGGVADQLRHSSAGVRTFLLMAALKGCMYDDGGIGQILYDFMDVHGILHHQAASIRQLQSLVSILSGNCEPLLTSMIDTHQELVRKLTYGAKESWTGHYFATFESKEMAKLLMHAFDAIQDRSIDYVELTGVSGLVWIASLLLWINQEEVGLFCWGQHLMGAAHGKVRLEIDSTGVPVAEDASWNIKTWRSGKWTEYVIPMMLSTERFQSRRVRDIIPRQSVRSFFLERDVDETEKTSIIGGVAAGLVDAALKLGRLSNIPPENPVLPRSVATKSIKRDIRYSMLCPETSQQRGGTILQDFGWNRESIADHQNSILNFMLSKPNAIKEDSITSFLRQTYPELDMGQELDIITSATKIAVHAIVAFHQEHDGCEHFYYNDHDSSCLWRFWSTDGPLLPLEILREKCYQLSGFEHDPLASGFNPLVLASNGRIGYPQVCIDHATTQSGLLDLRIIAGQIRFEKSIFSSVIEQRGERHSVPPRRGHSHWSASILGKDPPVFTLDPSPENYQMSDGSKCDYRHNVEYHFAVDSTSLMMRTYLSSPSGGKYDVNYRECIEQIAFATHLKARKIPLSMSIILQDFIERDLLQVSVMPCGQPGTVNNSRQHPRFVTMLPSSQESRFFEAHPQFMPTGVEDLYVQQGASLASCIRETFVSGKPKGGNWKIVTGSDRC